MIIVQLGLGVIFTLALTHSHILCMPSTLFCAQFPSLSLLTPWVELLRRFRKTSVHINRNVRNGNIYLLCLKYEYLEQGWK